MAVTHHRITTTTTTTTSNHPQPLKTSAPQVFLANNDYAAINVYYMFGDWAEESLLQAERALKILNTPKVCCCARLKDLNGTNQSDALHFRLNSLDLIADETADGSIESVATLD